MPAPVRPFISADKIEAELEALERAPSVDAEVFAASFDKLTDRSFELMVYLLFKAGGSLATRFQYDRVQLLPMGADRGRDVVLLARQQPAVVIQCKKHAGALSLPEVLREMSRLVLAATVDPTIVPASQGALTYVLAASGGLSEPAQALFNETPRILKEKETLISECALETREKYKSLQGLDKSVAVERVLATLRTASLHYLTSEDLDALLKEHPGVYAAFFAVRTVIETHVVGQQLAALTSELRSKSERRKVAAIESWYHPADSASFSVVARSPGEMGAPIVLDDVYVSRKLEASVNGWLDKARAGAEGVMVMIIAPGGYGKTSLLWNCHRVHSAMPAQALLFSASLIASKVDRGDFNESLVALVEHIEARVAGGTKVTVCLDTFDVLAHREDHQQAGLRLASELIAAGASVVMSSRPEEVALIPLEQLAALGVRLYLREYDEEEFAEAVSKHCRAFYRGTNLTAEQIEEQVQRLQNLVALGRPVKEVCLNPLTLRMLFELYAPNQVPEDINSFRLYSEYWTTRVRGDRRMAILIGLPGRDISAPAQRIAAKMLAYGVPLLSADQLSGELASGHLREEDVSALLSRNLIFRSGAGSLEFFHQTFFEHAAARYLDVIERITLDGCVARLRESANDAFRLPVYEQLFLLHAGRGSIQAMEEQVGALLDESHPGLLGVGLHAHMLSPQGYEAGRRFTMKAAQGNEVHTLKRFCQMIYNLQRPRVPEVIALIDAAWDGRDWPSMEAIARMFLWLAQVDWPACKRQLEKHDLVKALYDCAPNNTVDPERLVVSVFRHGMPHDAEWSFSQVLRCVRNRRHPRLALEFVGSEVSRVLLPAAEEALRLVVGRVKAAPEHHSGQTLDPPGRCIAAIWQAHPGLAPRDARFVSLDDSTLARLMLRALASCTTPATQSVRLALIDRSTAESQPGRLHVLMHEFIVPLIAAGHEAGGPVWEHACDTCEQLVVSVLDTGLAALEQNRHCGRVVSNAIKDIYTSGTATSRLWRLISDVSFDGWMHADHNLHLFPIAVAEGAPGALRALELVCADPQSYRVHASILKGALPSFSRTARRFDAVLRLAAATTDAQLLMAYFDKAEAFGEWDALAAVVKATRVQIEQIARSAMVAPVGTMRVSAFLLLAFLARHEVIAAPTHSEVIRWWDNERQIEVRTSALPLLVSATDKSTLESTVNALLRSASHERSSSLNQVVEQLREVLLMPVTRLSAELREALLCFALRRGAIEPQVSIVGRVIDLCIEADEMQEAHESSLRLLRGETARTLSATQKRTLGHHLDKPFLKLYRRLSKEELWQHVAELKQMDQHLGRLVVVSLCKSERPDIEDILNAIVSDVEVHPSLKRIIQDYRQFLWRR